MYFVKILTFTTPSAPPGMGIRVVEDNSGWFYLMESLKQEGITTPFPSLQHVEIAVGEPLTLVNEISRDQFSGPFAADRIRWLEHALARASDIFGSAAKARSWLDRPNGALGKVAPMSLLDSDEGVQRVLDVLGRIENGIFE